MRTATFRWMLYVTAYTAGLGIPLLVFPNVVLPVLGFHTTQEPWAQLCGSLLLGLGAITFTIHHKRIADMIVPTILVRSGIAVVLIGLGLAGYPPFLFVMGGVVLVGVVGTLVSLRRRSGEGTQ